MSDRYLFQLGCFGRNSEVFQAEIMAALISSPTYCAATAAAMNGPMACSGFEG
jgi:hypothetical protein